MLKSVSSPRLTCPHQDGAFTARVTAVSPRTQVANGLMFRGARLGLSMAQAVSADRVVKAPGLHSAQDRVDSLAEALPFIQRSQHKIVVVKYGGAAMKDEMLMDGVIKDLVLLSFLGLRPVLVHGGGPEINSRLKELGMQPQFKDGQRVTDAPTMEVVEKVLGEVNKLLVSLINRERGTAVGICGRDAYGVPKLITARPAQGGNLGFVGEITAINTALLQSILRDGKIPVIAPVAGDAGGQAYNVNADAAAGEIAASLGADKVILMTDVAGVLRDKHRPDTLVKEVDIKGVRQLVAQGIVEGGMIPKVECCVRSVLQGVRAAHIVDGLQPRSLLLEILTDEGSGTVITLKAS